ncbi:MAG: chorismate mutase, partial [Candidatus Omnitrophica bacterium]|nr:chorismate mutase [Candidatus Omnitrophota bacterium]
MNLKKLRKKIDAIDKNITGLLNSRAKITLEVGKIKQKKGSGVYSPDRERQILNNLSLINKGPLSQAALEAIYREIMSSSLSLNKALKIAYLGPEATFTHLAALKRFGSQVEFIACDSITDVFLEVERGSADYGVVPIENSVEGAVTHT